jgi:hypothetical protein
MYLKKIVGVKVLENQGTAIKGKLTTSEDSDKITTQNRKRL